MHRECFEQWEAGVLTYLKSCGRARSWSERQRHQNLWTKKGYDLAFKACGCLCGRGHIKKDLDWGGEQQQEPGTTPPPPPPPAAPKKKKRRNRHNGAPRPSLVNSHHGGGGRGPEDPAAAAAAAAVARGRAGSMSSSNESSSSPPASSEQSISPARSCNRRTKSEFFSDRSRPGNGGNGIFARRQDFSSFNSLPRHKLNSYHIKMEDEGNHGNDETRCFILSTLAAVHAARVPCLLCRDSLAVYDRYPLLDGTFFLSPRQHASFCFEVKVEGRTQFLSAVCMSCLEGWPPEGPLRCRCCGAPWDGSSLVLGTMYSYDIFAAMHCCLDRSRCNNCQRPMLLGHQKLNFSDYSHPVACPACRVVDSHFVKPLALCYSRDAYRP
ncbi:headcase protein [Bacillus rossius redtenbacheri]|uniref:headcase protein n=1 Tax=Bacillus rossius redtenbacheri TaxID=93214 RepID=UPI002FDD1CE3